MRFLEHRYIEWPYSRVEVHRKLCKRVVKNSGYSHINLGLNSTSFEFCITVLLWRSQITFPSLSFHNYKIRIKIYLGIKAIERAKNNKGKTVSSDLHIVSTYYSVVKLQLNYTNSGLDNVFRNFKDSEIFL